MISFLLRFSLDRIDQFGSFAFAGAVPGGVVPEEVDAVDGRRRRAHHGPVPALRLLRQAFSSNICQVSKRNPSKIYFPSRSRRLSIENVRPEAGTHNS